jgi:hypothetical protein
MFISTFILGWSLFPLVISQNYHDPFFRFLQQLLFCCITPIFIVALALYFSAEEHIRCQGQIRPVAARMTPLLILKYICLIFMLSSTFVLGWVFMPVILNQMFWSDYHGWMQFFMFIYSTPVFLVSLAGFIITEHRLQQR